MCAIACVVLQVYTGLILVNAGPMKYTLVHRICGFVSAMLNQVAQQQESSNKEIIGVFEQQQGTVLRVSKSTEECLQVRFSTWCLIAWHPHSVVLIRHALCIRRSLFLSC